MEKEGDEEMRGGEEREREVEGRENYTSNNKVFSLFPSPCPRLFPTEEL